MLRVLGQRVTVDGRVWAAFFGMALLNNAVPISPSVRGQHYAANGLASIRP